ncbi:nucleotidyltransferase family protein [Ruminococcus sp. HUN007]|uniref:nucleotidyltransferase domain-containing protein n=1 Tax=Ruminococcus sp. HUN007 TaxID=1514668 RepID=UPI0005D21C5F|nr:nucleotidyltransferase family protein [Ruminococcus sp. HUN007]
MEQNEYRKNALDMIWLTSCVLRGTSHDQERLYEIDLKGLFYVCQKHSLTACVAYALESAGIKDENFSQAKEKAIRKNILMDTERKKILDRLEKEKIWYMPLKGSLLKDWYPRLGMRQMSDNDILCDGSKRARIKEIMEDLGFKCEHYGKGNDDAYHKEPVCNFEMHNELFHTANAGNLHEYYGDVKDRLIKDENNDYGYHFRTEDFYIYITAHEYKHFAAGGTGVRSLVDTYVFLKKFSDSMDWDYIAEELKKLGIEEYEKNNRELALKFLETDDLTEEETKLLDYHIFSGSYGTVANNIGNLMTKSGGSKAKYIFSRIFIPMEFIQSWYPFFYRHKWLIPFLPFYRAVMGLTKNRKKVLSEFKLLCKR